MDDSAKMSCELHYPSLAQHFVNSLALAAQQLNRWDKPAPIPLTPAQNAGEYCSPFALSLGDEKVSKLATDLSAIAQNSLSQNMHCSCQITAQTSGWIMAHYPLDIQFSCIRQLAKGPIELHRVREQGLNVEIHPTLLFELQYCHARCCRLIRLTQEANMRSQQAISSQWFSAYFTTQRQSIEQELMSELLNFPNQLLQQKAMVPNPVKSTEKKQDTHLSLKVPIRFDANQLNTVATKWVALFQTFHSSVQFVPDTYLQNKPLLTLRETLLRAMRNIINFQLVHLLQKPAPEIL